MVRLAVLQLRVDDTETTTARQERVLSLLTELAGRADLVVLPELWTVGAFNIHQLLANAGTLDGPFRDAMAASAKAGGFWLHAGSIPEAHEGGVSNTSLLFDPDGTLEATYRKIHLFGFDEGEAASVSAGTDVVVTPTPLGMTGLATCYDLRFPELFRIQSAARARAYLLPSSWPAARVGHWSLLCRARALENQALLIGCNATGTHAGIDMGGRSVVVGPDGEVIAEAGGGEETLTVEVDPDTVEAIRSDFPVLATRRLG